MCDFQEIRKYCSLLKILQKHPEKSLENMCDFVEIRKYISSYRMVVYEKTDFEA